MDREVREGKLAGITRKGGPLRIVRTSLAQRLQGHRTAREKDHTP